MLAHRFFATSFARRSRRRRRTRGGYVLVMVLALLVISALNEAGLARKSLLRALEAHLVQSDLQRRWAAESCRRLLLGRAAQLFDAWERDAQREPRWPAPREVQANFELGGYAVRLRLADEDAKLSLNALHERAPDQLHARLLELDASPASLQLRPDLSSDAQRRKRTFASWGQLIALPELLQAPDGAERLLAVTSRVTCWGGGKLNLRRADDRSLAALVASVVGRDRAGDVLEARRRCSEELELVRFLQSLQWRRADQAKLRAALTDQSRCYSLWLEIIDGEGRSWRHLWVIGNDAVSASNRVASFHW